MADELRQMNAAMRSPPPSHLTPAELIDRITHMEIQRSHTRQEPDLDRVCSKLGRLIATRTRCVRAFPELERDRSTSARVR
jgi:hypothetical protein